MQRKLVSIITPSYNTGKYLCRLLDSVLGQTYPLIEMIVIDDGSTDDTARIIHSYVSAFDQRGFSFKYVKQENSGQSVAIQRGLDMIRGDYLVWPDSDDYYASPDAILKMVEQMEEMPDDIAMVRTQEYIVEDNPEHTVVGLFGGNASEREASTLFEDCLFEKNAYYYTPGAYMIKTDALRETTRLPIYTAKDAGQNWQLMLPVLYHYRCSTILEPLYIVVQRKASHSRGQYSGYENSIKKYTAYYDTIISTLDHIKNMDNEKRVYYQREIHKKYLTFLLKLSLEHCDKKNSDKFYQAFKQRSISAPFKYRAAFILLCMGVLPFALRIRQIFR